MSVTATPAWSLWPLVVAAPPPALAGLGLAVAVAPDLFSMRLRALWRALPRRRLDRTTYQTFKGRAATSMLRRDVMDLLGHGGERIGRWWQAVDDDDDACSRRATAARAARTSASSRATSLVAQRTPCAREGEPSNRSARPCRATIKVSMHRGQRSRWDGSMRSTAQAAWSFATFGWRATCLGPRSAS
jgi:hypothetical protein